MLSNFRSNAAMRRKLLNLARDVYNTEKWTYSQKFTPNRLHQAGGVNFTYCVARSIHIRYSQKQNVNERNDLLMLHRLPFQNVLALNHSPKLHIGLASYSTKSSTRFTLKNESFRKYLDSLESELHEIVKVQGTGGSVGSRTNERRLFLVPIMDLYTQLKERYQELEELEKMLADEDMEALAKEEGDRCMQEIEEQQSHLVDILAPDEHIDECDIHLEVESGAGGKEAMIFAEEVFSMYQGYSIYKGWKFDIVHMDQADLGAAAFRSASATISGQGVYRAMKYEGGIHRVQRVPKTERTGRIHTSTISIAVLPEPTEIDIVINPKDLRIDTYRSSGPGGQHVNKTESAVRMTHIPTGVVAECQKDRSQLQNRQTALKVLRTRLYEIQLQEQMSKYNAQRKMQSGSKNRSDKVRTYNFPQDRITDHRLAHNYNNIETFMTGGTSLDKMGQELLEEAKKENLDILLDKFEEEQKKTVRKGRK